MPAVQSKNWVFTLNNPEFLDECNKWDESNPGLIQYCIWQLEKGENGTYHLQGYLQLKKKSTLTAMKRLNDKVHWEVRKGSHQEAKDYVSKEDTRQEGPWEFGIEVKGSGARSDLENLKRSIDEGRSEKEVWDEHFGAMLKYHHGVKEYKRARTPKRTWQTVATVIYGHTGTGKTTWVKQHFPESYWHPTGSMWFDGYEGQETVIFDEFHCGLPFNQLLQLLDHTDTLTQTKGGHVRWVPKRAFFLTNLPLDDWYAKLPHRHLLWPALDRRLQNIWRASSERPFGDFIVERGDSPAVFLGSIPIAPTVGENEIGGQ